MINWVRVGLFVYAPIEIVKCRAQVMRDRHLSVMELMPAMIKEGGYISLYKGIVANCFRDVPGWGMYFYSYELLKEKSHLYQEKYLS